eukprot:TRINITY_DN1257_c0_g1_i8.p1 TRINITY_DN1257_c0_g1~~TRINITY_DN1257_c0_g1_i8.p1  ORF type:complete len:205 (-),score=73.00 TRINITY_DN1257_c0_g1_i8:115-729(-)
MIAKVVLTLTIASLATAAPQLFDSPAPARFNQRASGLNQNQVVTSVISTLQPAIAAAVAQALRGSSLGSSRPSGASGTASGSAFAGSNATPAKYNYEYKVANDNTQTYITQAEERDGLEVKGTYSYVDPTGAIVTVNYTAGELGYQESRERQEGALTIRPQPASATGAAGAGAGLDVDRLIAQVIAALEPAIQQSVSNVISRSG